MLLDEGYEAMQFHWANLPSLATLLQSRLLSGLMPQASDKMRLGAFIG